MGYFDQDYEREKERNDRANQAAVYEEWLADLCEKINEYHETKTPINWNTSYRKELHEWWMDFKETRDKAKAKKDAEEKQKKLKAKALSKLSQEEQEALGLIPPPFPKNMKIKR